jgi:hypothetical protein
MVGALQRVELASGGADPADADLTCSALLSNQNWSGL